MRQSSASNIGTPASGIKPSGRPRNCEVADAFERLTHARYAYIDSIEILVRKRFRLDKLRAIQRTKLWDEPCKDRDGNIWGWRVIISQPSRKTLHYLEEVQRDNGGSVFRFDIAIDLIAKDEIDAEELKSLVLTRALLKWRPKGPMLNIEGLDDFTTTYWIEQNKRKRRSNRDLALYADKPSKVTGEINCVHLELRFLNTRSCKKAGISSAKDLIDLNPAEIFAKNVKFTDFDIDQYHQRRIRKAVKEDRKLHQQQNREISEFEDRYRASRPQRMRGHLKRTQQDRAQIIKQFNPHLPMSPVVLNLPSVLERGIETSGKFQGKGVRCDVVTKQRRKSNVR
jgi:hypothetical protein